VTPLGAARMAQLIAAATAVVCAHRRPSYRPVAWFFATTTIANGLHIALWPYVVAPGGAPLEGFARALAHGDLALYFTYDFGLAATALWLFGSDRFRRAGVAAVAGAWLATVATCAALYPALRGDALRPVYRDVHIASIAVAVFACVAWSQRRGDITLAHLAFFLIVPLELGLLFVGPWRLGVFESWPLANIAYIVMYGALSLAQGWVICSSMNSKS
jgi:hypothetical protein